MIRSAKYLGIGPVVLATAFIPVAYAQDASRNQETCRRCPKHHPSDVYNVPPSKGSDRQENKEPTELEKFVQTCRQEITPIKEGVRDSVFAAAIITWDTWERVKDNVAYLRRAPSEVQYTAIGLGALTGSLLGFRRGLLRKIFYGSLGGLATTAIIYPKESKIVVEEGLKTAKSYGMIAWNFIVGSEGKRKP